MIYLPHSHPEPIGPEQRQPLDGATLFSPEAIQIGWLFINAAGWPVRAEITDPAWLDLADLPRKRLRAAHEQVRNVASGYGMPTTWEQDAFGADQ